MMWMARQDGGGAQDWAKLFQKQEKTARAQYRLDLELLAGESREDTNWHLFRMARRDMIYDEGWGTGCKYVSVKPHNLLSPV